jgi:arginase family enzyme
VLGGDCTVGIGTVAGHVGSGESTGLLYFDAHADLNTPTSVHEGALDWMGMAHVLGEEGAAPELVGVGARVPPDGLPDDPDEVAAMSWVRMKVLAARYSEELEANGDGGLQTVTR